MRTIEGELGQRNRRPAQSSLGLVEASYLFKSIGLSVKVMGGRTVNRERECALAAQCIGKLPGLRLWSYGAEGAADTLPSHALRL